MRGKVPYNNFVAAFLSGLVAAACVSATSHTMAAGDGTQRDRKVVYLVPDLPTFLYYLSSWNGERRFPIFMARDKYFEKFVGAYKPEAILKAKPRKVGRIDDDLLRGAVYASWGKETIADLRGGVSRAQFKDRLRRVGITARGIVLTDADARQLPAGLALAAAHRQVLDFFRVGASIRKVDLSGAMSFEQKEEIRKQVIRTIERWGYGYRQLGDDIDYITLALDLPIAYMASAPGTSGTQRLCLDDGINRLTPDGSIPPAKGKEGTPEKARGDCYAYVGRLLEVEEGMALYQAMCSIFLGTRKAIYFDSWPERWGLRAQEGWWVMQTRIPSILVKQNEASTARWRKLVGKLNPYDFLHVCSAGGAREWGHGKVSDIPESVPAVVYFAHSFSATNPYDESTIGGRWLRAGAYVYLGAVSEPYAQSFNTARTVALAAIDGEPLGKAFQAKRMLPGRFTLPWKQIYIGDPLHRMVFVEDKTESEVSRKFREAVGMIRERELGPAIELLEEALEAAGDAAERARVWQVLNRTFRLRFFVLRTGRLPVAEHVDSFFVDSWYNDTYYPNGEAAPAVVLNKRLNLFQKELVRVYEGLYRTVQNKPRLKALLAESIAEMKKDAGFVKIWIAAGPFTEEEDASGENPFGPEKVLRLDGTYEASAGTIAWQAGMVNPDDNYLDLAGLCGDKPSESVVYAACFPVLRAEEALPARLGLSATGGAEVWLNNSRVGEVHPAGEQAAQERTVDLELQPGESLLFLKVFRKGKRCGLSARLTVRSGGYLEDVEYADAVARLSAAGVKIDPDKWRPGK